VTAGGTSRSGRRGGAATTAGIDFQGRLAASIACAILAESETAVPWGWPEDVTVESIGLETREHVDDIGITSSIGARAHVQAKLTLSLSEKTTSEFGKAMRAFVGQYLVEGDAAFGPDDRLVLAVGPNASSFIREDLRRIVERARPPATDLAVIAVNERERGVREKVLAHLRAAWREQAGREPEEADLLGLLAAVHVDVHDFTNGGASTQNAQNLLRSSVVKEAVQAGQAWGLLIALAATLASEQTRADRERLQRHLIDRQVPLRAIPSYRSDVERLRRYSEEALAELAELSRISPPAGGEIKIARALAPEIGTAVATGSLLVTGDPGHGKSASVYEFVCGAREAGADVCVIIAEGPAAESLGRLRQELNLEHDLVEVLSNWPGQGDAYLVIDGLDAARREGPRKALLDLIAAAVRRGGRWRVLASVRRFDLRYNARLRELFAPVGAPAVLAERTDPEFDDVRHYVVPGLSEEELGQLSELAPGIHELLEGATDELRELSRVPFNLRLLAELVGLEVEITELEPVTTQVQLLDLYWRHRVIGSDGLADARVGVITAVARQMIAARRLQAERAPFATLETAPSLQKLLDEHVLTEITTPAGTVEREQIAFSHNVLFDFALAKVLLSGGEDKLSAAIIAQPDLVIFARPSFDFHFRALWEIDPSRARFWDACLAIAAETEVPQLGRVIGPVVATEVIREAADFEPLLAALDDQDPARRQVAEGVLRHLVGAALGLEPRADRRGAPQRRAWAAFAAALARLGRGGWVVAALQRLLFKLAADEGRVNPDVVQDLGLAARSLLDFGLSEEVPRRALTWTGIDAVVATFVSDPTASSGLLARIVERERLEEFGYQELPDLADHAEALVAHDPALLRDIYSAAFDYEETSKETTSMGTPILGLNSHRAQDYAGAHYSLAEAYPDFLRHAPTEAVEALVAVRAAYGRKRFERSYGEILRVEVGGGEAIEIVADGGSVWDVQPFTTDEEVKILGAFEERLGELATEDDRDGVEVLLAPLHGRQVPASIWRRIVRVATEHPEALAKEVAPLLRDHEVLCDATLGVPVGQFLGAAFPDLGIELRAQIERAIAGIPARWEAENPDQPEAAAIGGRRRDRVLGTLRPEDLVDAGLRERLEEMIAAAAVPSNDEQVFEVGDGGGYGERESLANQGVDFSVAANERLLELSAPVSEFHAEHLNGVPKREDVETVVDPLCDLLDALPKAERDGASNLVLNRSYNHAVQAAEVIARDTSLTAEDPIRQLALQVLLEAARHPEPPTKEESDEEFDESPGWSPAPRIEAAIGLLSLAREEASATAEVLDAIDALRRDGASRVRYQAARYLGRLHASAPERGLAMAEATAAEEGSTAVLGAVLRPLSFFLRDEPERLREITEEIYDRAPAAASGAQELRRSCAGLICDLYVYEGDERAGVFLRREVFDDPVAADELARQLVARMRDVQTYGAEGDARSDAVRARALGLIEHALERTIPQYWEICEELRDQEPAEDDALLLKGRSAAKLIDQVATELYFASGAFTGGNQDEPRASPVQRARLYREAGSIIDRLVETDLASATHHLLEMLEACIDIDPRGVFVRIAGAVNGGRGGNYHLDGMGERLVVRVIRRYLTEHATLLQDDAEVRELLIGVLDTFIEVGSPEALRLAYGLHELFR
jgi:hypothetical protein